MSLLCSFYDYVEYIIYNCYIFQTLTIIHDSTIVVVALKVCQQNNFISWKQSGYVEPFT